MLAAAVFQPPDVDAHEFVARLALAGLLGAVIGFEREWRDRTAGLRTHMLVCIGSALFTLISVYAFTGPEWYSTDRDSIITDPSRIAAQIVSGIGFLGAGAILRSGTNVQGLTTAASLWAMAAIGMAAGAGEYFLAVACTAIIFFVLTALRYLTKWIRNHQPEHAELRLTVEHDAVVARLLEKIGVEGANINSVSVRPGGDGDTRQLAVGVDMPATLQPGALVVALLDVEGVSAVDVKPPSAM